MIHYINIENILQQGCSPNIAVLFDLIEQEESPLVLSRKAKDALAALGDSEYKLFIDRSLVIRILQACKNFYTNMKLDKLAKLLSFSSYYNNEVSIVDLLFECNREELLNTNITYDKKGPYLTFNKEARVAEGIFKFGENIHQVFQKINEATT